MSARATLSAFTTRTGTRLQQDATTTLATRGENRLRLIVATGATIDYRQLRERLDVATRPVRSSGSTPLALCAAWPLDEISYDLMASIVCDAALGERDATGQRITGPIEALQRLPIAALVAVSNNRASLVILDDHYEPDDVLGPDVVQYLVDPSGDRGLRRREARTAP